MVVLLFAINTHILVTYTLSEPATTTTTDDDAEPAFCTLIDSEAARYYDYFVFPWIDLLVTSLLPSALLLAGNALLAATVARSARRARRMTLPGSGSGSGSGTGLARREKAASSLTVTLISVSVTYLCLTLPVCVFIVVDRHVEVGEDAAEHAAWRGLAWAVVNLMWYCNSAVNFYLYCLTGSRFRAQCRRLLCGGARGAPAAATTTSGVFVSTTGGSQSTVCGESEGAGKDGGDDF